MIITICRINCVVFTYVTVFTVRYELNILIYFSLVLVVSGLKI